MLRGDYLLYLTHVRVEDVSMLEFLCWVLGQFERDDCFRLFELLSAILLSDAHRDEVNKKRWSPCYA
jgi:hypothetical protein